MKCDKPNIPTYLKWNDKEVYKDNDFYYFHKLYRLKPSGNPIEIPEKYANAVSCRWSKLTKKKHITIDPPKTHYSDYDFVLVQEIRNYTKTGFLTDKQNQYFGKHVLTCVLHHSPEDCNYSHCEVLIRHQVFKHDSEEKILDEVCSHKDWVDKTAILNKEQGKFFKGLKSAFRLDMIKLVSRPPRQNNWKKDIKTFFKQFEVNSSIEPIFSLEKKA
jgi:hypothetical protein